MKQKNGLKEKIVQSVFIGYSDPDLPDFFADRRRNDPEFRRFPNIRSLACANADPDGKYIAEEMRMSSSGNAPAASSSSAGVIHRAPSKALPGLRPFFHQSRLFRFNSPTAIRFPATRTASARAAFQSGVKHKAVMDRT